MAEPLVTIIMRQFIVICVMVLFASISVRADDSTLIMPSSELSPEQVIEIQLLGLSAGGDVASFDPHQGIKQVWVFAHPDNRRVTGPLMRIAQLFINPAYAPMVGHTRHEIEPFKQDETEASFIVSITAQDGRVYAYLWSLRLTEDGDASQTVEPGWWMTSSVSAPRIGDAS